MKSVLISIHPKWCELIVSGEKTIEVRKSRPKIETPFKCYIYETKARSDMPTFVDEDGHTLYTGYTGRGQVIGEFVCDKIYDIEPHYDIPNFCNQYIRGWKFGDGEPCLSFAELGAYLGGKHGYGWHISDLKIYDKPKELGSFWKAGKCPYASESGCAYEYHCFRSGQTQRCGETLTRPPQSWCYVEVLQ